MKYFTFTEFERSAIARRYAIDNTMPEAAKKNAAALVDNVLDPLREAWGGPIDVSSGYRCAALNKAVGGAAGSQHMAGEAADIRVYVRDSKGRYVRDSAGNAIVDKAGNRKLMGLILELGLEYDQLIDEQDYSWIHVSYKRGAGNRKQTLKL